MPAKFDLPQGTLDLLILKVVALGPVHGYAIAQRLHQVSRDVVQAPQGTLYPALHRLENRGLLAEMCIRDRHMTVQIRLSAGLDPGDGETESHHHVAVVGAENLAADAVDDDQKSQRQQLDIGITPNGLLQVQHLFEIRELEKLADFDYRLASCHRASISSMLESSSLRPRSASFCSM